MNNTQTKLLWLAALLLALLIGGCSGNSPGAVDAPSEAGPPPTSGGQTETTPKPVEPPKPVELVFYSLGNASPAAFDELYGNVIRSKYPHFTLNYVQRGGAAIDTYITNLLMSGAHDINFDSIGNIPALLKYELEYDMTDLIRQHQLDLSRYDNASIEGMKTLSGGKMYGLPVFNTNRLLFYNKDLFDKFGVPYPKDKMSWDEAIELGKRMTRSDDGVQYVGLSSSREHQIRMNALSVPLVDPQSGKATINSDERWRTIFTKGFYEPYDDSGYRQLIEKALPNRNNFYNNKTLAMMVYLSFMPANEPDILSKMNWDMVSEPSYRELPGVSSQVYPTYFSISSASKHKDEAMQAIMTLMSVEHQTKLSRLGQMPVLNDASVQAALGKDTVYPDKNWGAVFQTRYAPVPFKSMYDVDVEKVYLKHQLPYSQGKVDLNTTLRLAEEEANQLLQTLAK